MLRAEHFQPAALRLTAAFEIYAADEFLIPWRELLSHDEFVSFEDFSLFVQVSGLELNLVVGEPIAIVAEPDYPGGLGSRKFRTEFGASDDDIPCRIRTPEHGHQPAPVLPDAENQNDSDKKQPSRNNPLAGPQELKHLALLSWEFLQSDGEVDFPVPSQYGDGDPFTRFVPIHLGSEFKE
jgi:hypothetical protein